ncbi:homoserine O-succinyltransferase [compost metagenome]
MESEEMGVCLVHEKEGNRLYMFNHVEYDSTSLSDAHLFFGNWINEIYQTTPYDLEAIGQLAA